MKKSGLLLTLFMLCFFFQTITLSQEKEPQEKPTYHKWWEERYFSFPKPNPKASILPLISVKGNKFINSKGDTILFRGLAIGDPDKLENQGHWNKDHFMKVKEMGALLVRIPVHPVAWRERTSEKYLELLDQAVDWCADLGMYIIIDWHSIGNLRMELFQDPMYNTSQKETFEFWRTISAHFRGNNTIAFYEIYNEPATFNGLLGRVSWDEWKKLAEDIISLIRAYDKETIPLVAGFDWAYDLTPIHLSPLEAQGIGYVTHPYPNKRPKPWEPKWEEDFGFAAGNYPVIATEIGFSPGWRGHTENDDYGKRITDYLESKGISWTAWVFDADWYPKMIESWETYELTKSGEFFKQAMQGEVRQN